MTTNHNDDAITITLPKLLAFMRGYALIQYTNAEGKEHERQNWKGYITCIDDLESLMKKP